MSKLMALLQFLLALCGVGIGGTSFSDRVSVDGSDTLNSRARVQAGIAHFNCLASVSGRCHYTLFVDANIDDCNDNVTDAGTTPDCPPTPLKQFAVPAGDSREFTGLPGFRLCVSADDLPRDAQCKASTSHSDPRVASGR